MKLSALATATSSALPFRVETVESHPKREGYYKISGILADGSETFIVATEKEWEVLPTAAQDDRIVNLAGFAVLRKNKIGKSYIERVTPLPSLNEGKAFSNPFSK